MTRLWLEVSSRQLCGQRKMIQAILKFTAYKVDVLIRLQIIQTSENSRVSAVDRLFLCCYIAHQGLIIKYL